ncbi:DUF2167 domain-containing protein [Rhizobium alvei]|uniref:DUF2167 domain-containing protein n=1 Tax=Rhizobium alvei TaxID=1132659 RepID=A0ABT8YIE8_9HYPH|nr:DUF2167 domain-containing protein [Rhizobium alvei]MDO6963054.1 DUF2167 domain-containing protein [Rhizobium alvei]
MKLLVLFFALFASLSSTSQAATYQELFGKLPENPELAEIVKTIDFQQGKIDLPVAEASLKLGKDFYYLGGEDTEKVLVKIWGNPPGAANGTLGMIFPVQFAPESQGAWGSIITWDEEGHVSDDDAAATNFDAVLADLKQQTLDANPERTKEGYEPITLVGWASPPHYDRDRHVLHWARDLLFGTDQATPHTLNYQMRVLGREGVVGLNFVAGMDQLEQVKQSIEPTMDIIAFNPGKAYDDYVEGDKLAAYGLGGLIAAGAGAKIAAKLGFLAIFLAFFKKAGVVVVLALGALLKPVLGLFRRKQPEPVAQTVAEPENKDQDA